MANRPTILVEVGREHSASNSARVAAVASNVERGRTCEETRLTLGHSPLPIVSMGEAAVMLRRRGAQPYIGVRRGAEGAGDPQYSTRGGRAPP